MCYKGWEDNYVVLRVPFRKNGSGMHLNQYTVSLFVKFREVDKREDFGLLASQGWDQFSKPKENEKVESALAFVTDTGGLGALGSFGDKRHVLNNTWHTITVTVDTVAGCMKTYCDAELGVTIQSGGREGKKEKNRRSRGKRKEGRGVWPCKKSCLYNYSTREDCSVLV
jgi:hypothetical protein